MNMIGVISEFDPDMLLNYRSGQVRSKDMRYTPSKHNEYQKTIERIFFELTEIFKNYDINNDKLSPEANLTLRKMIYNDIEADYYSRESLGWGNKDFHCLNQSIAYNAVPDLFPKIKKELSEYRCTNPGNSYRKHPVDFRVTYFINSPSQDEGIFGAIVTNDMVFLDLILQRTDLCSSDILG